jgi:hypothetical protein
MTPLDNNMREAIQGNSMTGKADAETQKQAAKVLSPVSSGILICKKRHHLFTYSNSEGQISHLLDYNNRDNNIHASNNEGLHFAQRLVPLSTEDLLPRDQDGQAALLFSAFGMLGVWAGLTTCPTY